VWAWIGVVPLATGFMGWCPAYTLLGIKTCPMKKDWVRTRLSKLFRRRRPGQPGPPFSFAFPSFFGREGRRRGKTETSSLYTFNSVFSPWWC